MEEEIEICRVCRCEGTESNPLFYPCRCSGSIKFVHEECLKEWLFHSKKKYCELCKCEFHFSPVFSPNMPESIPLHLFLKRLILRALRLLRFILRAFAVAAVWLALIPYLTMWQWKWAFWSGNIISYRLAGLNLNLSPPSSPIPTPPDTNYFLLLDSPSPPSSPPPLPEEPLVEESFYEFIIGIALHCFKGQVISTTVVVAFMGMFLLREWVLQNFPNAGQEDILPPPPPPPPPVEAPLPPVAVAPVAAPVAAPVEAPPPLPLPVDPLAPLVPLDPIIPTEIPLNQTTSSEKAVEELEEFNVKEDTINPKGKEPLGVAESSTSHLGPLATTGNELVPTIVHDSVESSTPFEVALVDPPLLTVAAEVNEAAAVEDVNEAAAVEEVNEVAAAERVNVAAAEVIPEAAAAAAAAGFLDDDVLDLNGGDVGAEDFEGLMDGIGLQGPFANLFQNAFLVGLLVSTGLMTLVWFPYVLGKTVLLMPIRNYWAFPIRVIRLFTDPFVDFFIDIWLPAFGRAIFFPTLRVLTRMFDLQVLDYEEVLVMSDEIITTIPVNQFILARSNEVPIFSYCSDEMVTYGFFDEWMRFFQPQFCSTLAVRGICVFAGWALISLLLLSYLYPIQYTTIRQHFNRASHELLVVLGMMIKVLFFMVIELLIFPLICGMEIAFLSSPVFGENPFLFVYRAPTTAIFLLWASGTGFMFLFATTMSVCRHEFRPGVLYFIRDPESPEFHPMREILERSAMVQLSKIGKSLILYSATIASTIGVIILLSSLMNVFPLKFSLKTRYNFPFDLLVLHFLLPLFPWRQKRRWVRKTLMRWCRFTTFWLRLSPYFFGGNKRMNRFSGLRALVPSHDGIKLQGQPAIIYVDKKNKPLNPNIQIRDMRHREVVYLPHYFKLRVTIFLLALLLFSWTFGCLLFLLPLCLGRWMMSFVGLVQNDVQALVLGCAMTWALILFPNLLRSLSRWLKSVYSVNFLLLPLQILKGIFMLIRVTLLSIEVGILLPLLTGLVIRFHLLAPFHPPLALTTVQSLIFDWVMGLLMLKMASQRVLQDFLGFNLQPREWDLNKLEKQAFSLITHFVILIVLPLVLNHLLDRFQIDPKNRIYLHPCTLLLYLAYQFTSFWQRIWAIWTETIRTEEYVIGERLHNFDVTVTPNSQTIVEPGLVQNVI